MRYILLVLLLSLPLMAAKNYVAEDKAGSRYVDKGDCEKLTAKKCYDFEAGKDDLEVMLVKEFETDDYSNPIYAARTNETDCQLYEKYESQADDCRNLTAIGCNEAEPKVCEPVLCSDKSYFSVYASKAAFGLGEGDFAYCTKVLGYAKIKEKKLVEDAGLKAAKLARLAAEKAAKDAKDSDNNTRQQELKAHIDELQVMIDAFDAATNAQRWDMVKAALKIQKKMIKQDLKDLP